MSETEKLWIMLSDVNDGWPVLNYNMIINFFRFVES